MLKKIVLFVIVVVVFAFCWNLGLKYFEPQVSISIAVDQADYDSTNAQALARSYGQMQNLLYNVPIGFSLLMFVVFFGKGIVAFFKAPVQNNNS